VLEFAPTNGAISHANRLDDEPTRRLRTVSITPSPQIVADRAIDFEPEWHSLSLMQD
jgi:hypothetical protein